MTKRKMTIRDIVTIGVLAALCALGTTLKVPLGGAMVHLGTAVLLTTALVFGGVYAGFSGAVGSAFFDLVMGATPYTLWSFVIKGMAGLLAGTIAVGVWPEDGSKMTGRRWAIRAAAACLTAAAWTLGGYILAWWQVTGSLAVAVGNAPASLLTSAAGIVVAFILSPKLRKALNR